MNERKKELVLAWLAKAMSDLETARLLIQREKRLLDIAAYHCQQSAEKALKAWLTSQDIVFPKTHELEELLGLCLPTGPGFEQLRQACEELTPLAQEFRYPGDVAEPTVEEAQRALGLAEHVYTFCERLSTKAVYWAKR